MSYLLQVYSIFSLLYIIYCMSYIYYSSIAFVYSLAFLLGCISATVHKQHIENQLSLANLLDN